jgi:hypothetical protein
MFICRETLVDCARISLSYGHISYRMSKMPLTCRKGRLSKSKPAARLTPKHLVRRTGDIGISSEHEEFVTQPNKQWALFAYSLTMI